MTQQVMEDRFVSNGEWYDKQADLKRNYLLTYYPKDKTIEMVSNPQCLTLLGCE